MQYILGERKSRGDNVLNEEGESLLTQVLLKKQGINGDFPQDKEQEESIVRAAFSALTDFERRNLEVVR